MSSMRRVAVALSGGVDSAVAALILKRQTNLIVEGVFMQNWDSRIETEKQCTVETDFDFAQRIAKVLQIPLRRINFIKEYWHRVFENVISEYSLGRTPNPDMQCNREIKFGELWRWAQAQGYDHMATGHYAQIINYREDLWIAQAKCVKKDQSYFLSTIPRGVLPRVSFPLGLLPSKDKVRQIALENELDFVGQKAESMGVCFVGRRRHFSSFLAEFMEVERYKVVNDVDSRILGDAESTLTLGQRVKVGGLENKAFVIRKDPFNKLIHVTQNQSHPVLNPLNINVRFCTDPAVNLLEGDLFCSIRSTDKIGVPVKSFEWNDESPTVIHGCLPFQAPAPGQIAVIYKNLPSPSTDRIVIGAAQICDENT